MIIAKIGPAVTPLMTALQNNALIGSSGVKVWIALTIVENSDHRVEDRRPAWVLRQAAEPLKRTGIMTFRNT